MAEKVWPALVVKSNGMSREKNGGASATEKKQMQILQLRALVDYGEKCGHITLRYNFHRVK